MIHKRLTPEERKGVFFVVIIALLVIILGFCHKCIRGDSGSAALRMEEIGRASENSPDDSTSLKDYEESDDIHDFKKKSGSRRKRGGERATGKRKSASSYDERGVERDYLEDTIP